MTSSSYKEVLSGIDLDELKKRYAEERERRLRSDANAQYIQVRKSFAHFAEDPHVEPGFTREPIVEDTQVVIMGAGFSGLLTAGRLRQAGVRNLRIIDKAGDFGGTWYWNRYPGAACDIESYIYMPLLEDVDYIPTEKYAKAPEIFAHCQRLGKYFDLYDSALFQTAISGMVWDGDTAKWIVSTDRGDRISAQNVIIAGGFLSQPKLPGIPGIESFQGHSFHSSRWDYEYTGGDHLGGMTGLGDKVVGIVGTGATSLQCIPFLAQSAKHLYVFQRTPSSVDERANRQTDPAWAAGLPSGWQRRRMENFNNILSGIREDEDMVGDGWTRILSNVAFLNQEDAASDAHQAENIELAKMELVRQRIDELVKDRATAEALKPYYNYLCKRPGFNDEYLDCFNQANVTLVDTQGKGIDHITQEGPVVDGEVYPVDCLIYATGFEYLTEFTNQIGFEIQGKGGQTLSEKWSDGTRTLHGIQTRGFPNMYILGFAQNGIPANFTHLAQERADHLAYLISRTVKEGIRTIEPTQEAEDEWVADIIATRGPRRAFLEACTPSYYNLEGKATRATDLNDIFGAGSPEFFRILKEWREDDTLRGMEVHYSDEEN